MTADDHAQILALADGLGEWFNEQGRQDMAIDLCHQPGIVAEQDGRIVGFLTWFVAEASLCIGWIAVKRDTHRRGVGRAMIEQLVRTAHEMGVKRLRVWTLSQREDYPPYESTRAFYQAMGYAAWKQLPGYCEDGSEMEIYQRLIED